MCFTHSKYNNRVSVLFFAQKMLELENAIIFILETNSVVVLFIMLRYV